MDTNITFSELGIGQELNNALQNIGFTNASPIQERTIPIILDGKDINALAETGSGKTGSFAIPLIEKILSQKDIEHNGIDYIILSPTRELAQQTHSFIMKLASGLNISSACLIGGESIEKQKEVLESNPYFLVATPGRLCDLTKQKSINLSGVKGIVFDEADRLFDMGFKKDIEFVLKGVPETRQLIMVSATTNMDVLQTAYKFRSHPEEVRLNEDSLLVDNIDHSLAMLSNDEKMPYLVNLLENHKDTYALVFCNTQIQTHVVAEWLNKMGHKAKPISGRLPQSKRTKLMEEFRNKEITILVCTDVAARGLDIKDVNLVVNYDLPQEAANYVHRIGRTGRAGKEGMAISLCAHEDCEFLEGIYKLIDTKIPKLDINDEDFATNLCPKPHIDFKTLKVKSDQKNERSKDRKKDKNHKDNKVETKNYAAKVVTPTKFNPFVQSEANNRDSRFFVKTSSSKEDVIKGALGYFQIKDESLCVTEVIKKGRKKFFFFGERKDTYQVSLFPNYKKILSPFLIEIIKLARLNLYVKVFYKEPTIKIVFSGNDERLLTRNNNELLRSIEQIAKLYLSSKITLDRSIKINVSSPDSKNQEKDLLSLADKLKSKVIKTGLPVQMKPLNAAERRLVHQHLGDDKKVQTNSIGEGRLKKIEISLR